MVSKPRPACCPRFFVSTQVKGTATESMANRLLPALILLGIFTAAAAQSGQTRYISDEITLTIRDAPRNDATYLGVIRSGEQVELLENLGPQSFARIRLENGTEGWVTSRYLSDAPAARDQLEAVRGELSEAQQRMRTLETQLADTRERLSRAGPALQMADENKALQDSIREMEAEREHLMAQYSQAQSQRQMLITGAGLLAGGMLLGLVLPWLSGGRRRRRNEL
jgi:SH3 domain protein